VHDHRPQVIGEDFSPWTEKALWALDHHRVRYAFKQYQPLIEEPWLRIKTRNLTGRATVPVLIAGGEILSDSLAIARWAEGRGGSPLFVAGHEREIEAWNERSDRALRAGRALFFERLSRDPEAQSDNLPPFVPRRLRPLLRLVVRTGIAYLRKKHGSDRELTERAHAELDAELAELGKRIAAGRYLLGSFSYADVAMAVACQFFAPVDDRYIHLTFANRACWTEPTLAETFRDVIAWRDAIYADHRPVRA
jgi:glutathione S-transferase